MKNQFEELNNFLKTLIKEDDIDILKPFEGFNKSKHFINYEKKRRSEDNFLLQNKTHCFNEYKLDEIVINTSPYNLIQNTIIARISFFKEMSIKNHNYTVTINLMPEKMSVSIEDDRIRETNFFSITNKTDKYQMEGVKNYTQFVNMMAGKNLSKKDTAIFESSFETNAFFYSLTENNNEELLNTVLSDLFQKKTINTEIVDLLLLHDIALNHNAIEWLEIIFDDFYQIAQNTFKPESIKQKISI